MCHLTCVESSKIPAVHVRRAPARRSLQRPVAYILAQLGKGQSGCAYASRSLGSPCRSIPLVLFSSLISNPYSDWLTATCPYAHALDNPFALLDAFHRVLLTPHTLWQNYKYSIVLVGSHMQRTDTTNSLNIRRVTRSCRVVWLFVRQNEYDLTSIFCPILVGGLKKRTKLRTKKVMSYYKEAPRIDSQHYATVIVTTALDVPSSVHL